MKWDLKSVCKMTYGAACCAYGMAELHPDDDYSVESLEIAKGVGALTLVAGLAAREQERDDKFHYLETTVNHMNGQVGYLTDRARADNAEYPPEEWDPEEES